MKDMYIPLDAIWLRNGEIVDFSMDLHPAVPGEEIPIFRPIEPADAVIKVKQGFIMAHHLRIGLPVDIRIDRKGALR